MTACVITSLTGGRLYECHVWFVSDLLVDLLCVLASYSITVNELRTLFSLLRVSGNKWVSCMRLQSSSFHCKFVAWTAHEKS